MNVWYKYNAIHLKCFLVLFFCTVFFYNQAQGQALDCNSGSGFYTEQAQPGQVFVQTQVYREAVDFEVRNQRLAMDIYRLPSTLAPGLLRQRPLVVLLHGGGIKGGSRQTGLLPALAEYFAKRGYVAISADYRLGWPGAYETPLCGNGSENDYLDAHYRAMQDERALIRYLKRQAANIGFDTNRIFLMGISSGATVIISRLNNAALTEDPTREQRLGPLDSQEQGNSSIVAGLISIAGASLDESPATDFSTPVLFFHGTCDNAVPYRSGRLALCPNLGKFYGPGIQEEGLKKMESCYELHTFCGFGHDFAALEDGASAQFLGLDYILKESIRFMRSVMCAECSSRSILVNNVAVISPAANCSRIDEFELCGRILPPEQTFAEIHPEVLGSDRTIWVKSNFDFDRMAELRIYDSKGALVFSREITLLAGVNRQVLSLPHLPKGMYPYELVSGVRRWKAGKFLQP